MKSWLATSLVCLGLLAATASGARAATAGNGFTTVDLSPHTLSREEPVLRQLAPLPDGALNLNGVPFQTGSPVLLAGLESARIADVFPHTVAGIKVGRPAERIHLLHATLFAEKDGAPLAKVIFHYANGTQKSTRLGYGVHARSWVGQRREKRGEVYDGHSRLAWSGMDTRRDYALRLFHTALENPMPGEVIASLEFVSLFSHATPLIMAITVEDADAKPPRARSLATRKAVRELNARPESVYRQELAVHVTDEAGAALTNAVASLSITDDKESFFLTGAAVDARGAARLPYPPLHAVGVSLWIHAPGKMPVIITESKTNRNQFTGSYAVKLKPGTTIGGVVKDAQGRPVAGAEVVIHKATRLSAHHYSRVDYDLTRTGSDGRWSSGSLPADLSGLGLHVSHADFRSAFFMTAGSAPPPTAKASSTAAPITSFRQLPGEVLESLTLRPVPAEERKLNNALLTSNALLASSAEMVLQPAILLQGTLVDAANQPVPQAEVIVQPAGGARKFLRTDGAGKFQTPLPEPGDAALMVVRAGFAPLYRALQVRAGLAPVEVKLAPARVLRGRVQDRAARPVAGALVRLDEWQGTADLVRFSTLTDDQGVFMWTGAPPDQVTFYVSKTNYLNIRRASSGSVSNLLITINRPPGVHGRVFDADTKEPVERFFVVPGRKYSPGETRINWERSGGLAGFGGEYSLRMSSYFFQPEARVLIEAPGYEPQISPAFTGSDAHTNDFFLKRGKGLSGTVLGPDGQPAAGAALTIIEKGDSGYMDQDGQVRGSGASGDTTRSDAQGRFEFSPKLEPHKLFVTHALGFGEARVADVAKGGALKLQKWARVQGVLRVGQKGATDAAVRLSSEYPAVAEPDGRASHFSFSLKAEPDADGNFVFEKVPPGEHRLAVEYKFKDDRSGELALSHGILVPTIAGETAQAVLGGTGRRVGGRVALTGGDHSDVDWKRDVHRLVLMLPPMPGRPGNQTAAEDGGPLVFLRGFLPQNSQPVGIDAMRERQRAERSYVLLVDTNGTFRADHIPPGKYQLTLNVTDPEDEYYNRRSIGAMNMEVTVPDEKVAVNTPHDLGTVSLAIKPRLRVGKTVPSFEGKGADGKTIQLSEFHGKPVLLHFWGMSLGYNTSELQILKELQANYGARGQLVILGCNLDGPANNPAQFAKSQGLLWKQMYLGPWNQTPVPGLFGLNGNTGCVLIDADGKLASGVLRSTQIRVAVADALEE